MVDTAGFAGTAVDIANIVGFVGTADTAVGIVDMVGFADTAVGIVGLVSGIVNFDCCFLRIPVQFQLPLIYHFLLNLMRCLLTELFHQYSTNHNPVHRNILLK